MSTSKYYLTTKTAPYTPATIRGAWDDTAGAVTRALDVYKRDGGLITSVSRAETSSSNTYDVLLYRGVSGPLAAQTIAGTIDVVLAIRESAASADFVYHLHVYVTAGDSDTVRGTLLSDYIETTANEWPTTLTAKALASAQTLSSLAISAGDRLVVEIGYQATNTSASSLTGFVHYGTQHPDTAGEADDLTAGSTDGTIKAGFISFSAAITEQTLETRVTQFAPEFANSGSNETRITQFAGEFANSGSNETRITQFCAEFVSPGGDDHINVFAAM